METNKNPVIRHLENGFFHDGSHLRAAAHCGLGLNRRRVLFIMCRSGWIYAFFCIFRRKAVLYENVEWRQNEIIRDK